MNLYIPGTGNPNAKLLILGEAPSYEEEQQLKPFVGSSGRELDKLLRETGIDRSQCWLTNVCKYMVPPNVKFGKKIPFDIRAKSVGINIDEELANLRTELYQLPNLNCILALGGTAFWALSGIRPKSRKKKDDSNTSQQFGGISDYRGSILYGMGKKFVATYHPAHLLHMGEEVSGYYQREIMKLDFKRAKVQSEFPEIRRPYRSLEIAKSSAQLEDYFQRNRTRSNPGTDIEAGYNCIPNCIGLSLIPSEGITIPLWHQNGVVDIPPSDHAQMVIKLARYLANNDIIGQNFKYDEDKINRLGYTIRSLFSDTMLKSFAVHPELPKNLAFNTSIYTEEPFYKNEGMYEGSTEDLFIGCARDSCVTKEIDLALDAPLDKLGMKKYYENFIRHLHSLYLSVETTGFLVDEPRREELLRKYITWEERLGYERFHIAKKEINTNSHLQVKDFLFNIMKCPVRESTGEDQLTSLYNQVKNVEQREAIDNVLTDRRIRKTTSTYLLAMPDFDGRMKTTYYLCLETGRTSTGQLDPPIRPDFEYRSHDNKLKHKSIGTAFQTLTKHGDIGQDVRSIYKADPGYVILNIDSSQAEARVIFLLAEDYDALTLIDTCDYHALTASWFVGGTEELWSKKFNNGKETPQRFLGKAQPLHSKILTPNGWKLMGDIQIGDEICNSSYGLSKVTGIFPQGNKEVFKINLSDGSNAESCKEHLWQIQSIWDRQRDYITIKTLNDIMNLELKNKRGNPKYSIQRQNAVELNYNNISIDPYVLGVMLGDGNFTTPYGCSFFTDDEEILNEIVIRVGIEKISNNTDRTYYISELRPLINELGLGNHLSHEKFIPENFKINTLDNRLQLLQGLMDTDGTINEFGSGIEFSSSSKQLADDVIFLVRSLGGIANMTDRIPKYEYKGEVKEGRKSYRVFINIRQLNPFKLTRKAERWERWNAKTKYDLARNIISIEKSGEYECQCISVDSEDHLYITDDFILTHNTLRHAGHLGASGRRAMLEVNTAIRKNKIPLEPINERYAGDALKVFHKMQPKIRGIFQAGVIKCIENNNRQLRASVPFGVDAEYGPVRTFFERYGDELFRQAFSYIPQRSVTDNTKNAMMRCKKLIPNLRIVVESHDSFTSLVRHDEVKDHVKIMQAEMERPISFKNCSLSRRDLIIPSEVEVGENYMELVKYKE